MYSLIFWRLRNMQFFAVLQETVPELAIRFQISTCKNGSHTSIGFLQRESQISTQICLYM